MNARPCQGGGDDQAKQWQLSGAGMIRREWRGLGGFLPVGYSECSSIIVRCCDLRTIAMQRPSKMLASTNQLSVCDLATQNVARPIATKANSEEAF